MPLANQFYQCDACGRFTDRAHFLVCYGLDTAGCDECVAYDADAYDEPEARYFSTYPTHLEQPT